MNAENTGALGSIELTGPQAELLVQLERFLCLVTSDEIINAQALPEVCKRLFIILNV